MAWPDFCFGKSGLEGAAESLRPWEGCWPQERQLGRRAEDGRRSACPGYRGRPQRSEQEQKLGLKETSQAFCACEDRRCPERGWQPRGPGKGRSVVKSVSQALLLKKFQIWGPGTCGHRGQVPSIPSLTLSILPLTSGRNRLRERRNEEALPSEACIFPIRASVSALPL